MDDGQDYGGQLDQLHLSGEKLVGDKVVLDVFVIVLQQVDADERVDSGGR